MAGRLSRLALLLWAEASAAMSVATHGAREALITRGWLDLRRNLASHAREVAQSTELGFEEVRALPPPPWRPPGVRAWDVASTATGMGPVCPFAAPGRASAPRVFETDSPLLSGDECEAIIEETRDHIAAGRGGSVFTLATTNRNIAIADLPRTLGWLNAHGLPRVAALAGECFGEEAIGDPRQLLIYRALVVQYDAAAGLTHQEVHRDGSLVTAVVTLNDRSAYTGGGTYLEDLGEALAPPRGHALLQASALRHAGHVIDSGERWVMVLFLISAEMRYGEHVSVMRPLSPR